MHDDQQMLIEHRQTWKGFCALVKWSCIAIAITLLLMWWLLV